jgi:hypothetical protein
MVYISVAREEDYIDLVPTTQFHLLACGGEKIG